MGIVFVLFSFLALAQPGDPCIQHLTEYFPRTWRIDQKKIDQYLDQNPEELKTFLQYSKLAEFIEDARHEAFFDWLGTQYYLSTDQKNEMDLDAEIKKYVIKNNPSFSLNESDPAKLNEVFDKTVNTLFKFLEQNGLGNFRLITKGPFLEIFKKYDLDIYNFVLDKKIPPSSLRTFLTLTQLLYAEDPEIHSSTEELEGLYEPFFSLLGESKFESKQPLPKIDFGYNKETLDKIWLFLKSSNYPLPEYSTLLKHSEVVQVQAVAKITHHSKQKLTENEESEVLEIYRNQILGTEPVIPFKFKNLIADLEDDDIVLKISDSKKSIAASKNMSEKIRLGAIQATYLARASYGLMTDKSINSEVAPNESVTSYRLFSNFVLASFREISIDQGLEPMIRKAFVKVFLDKSILSSASYRAMMRTRLKQVIALKINTSAQHVHAESKPTTPQPQPRVGPTREERIANYVKIEKEPAEEPAVEPRNQTDETESKSDFLSQLLDEPQDLATDRRRLLELIKPDKIIPITLKRFGFVYQVVFSKRALEELASPRAQFPQDFRPWLKAMSMGPARGQGQNGWKRISGHEWKIKILTSPYRLYSYRDKKRIWHFTQFQLDH